MNIDHSRMTAESGAMLCGRASSGFSFVSAVGQWVSHTAAACALACAAVVAVAPAQAQDRGAFRNDVLQQQRDERGDRNAQRQDAPRYDQRDQRDQRADDARRQQQERSAERHSGRLTPDERRDLRRQINEAGVDLYPNTPRR